MMSCRADVDSLDIRHLSFSILSVNFASYGGLRFGTCVAMTRVMTMKIVVITSASDAAVTGGSRRIKVGG